MQLRQVTLEDKYTATGSDVLMSGTQAMVRVALLQHALDKAAGLNTAGYISGYRGSPVGGYDYALWAAQKHLEAHQVVFEPGVNEDIAATAIWGTQQLATIEQPLVDGVFAIWYGKAPGVDRSLDALKHANIGGAHPHGGVLVMAGDDHAGKSSTLAAQSEPALIHCMIPVLSPATVQDCLDFALAGFALSRYAGVYVGFKTTNETLELTATVTVDPERWGFVLPDRGELPPEGIHFRSTHIDRQRSEIVHNRYRLPLVRKFVRANGLDRVHLDSPRRTLGIVTAGHATQYVRQALMKLGIDAPRAAELGVSLYQVGCVWPLEPEGLRAFAAGQQELLFVEEKRALVEPQATQLLYGQGGAPRITGKQDEAGNPLLPDDVQLDAASLALVIHQRLARAGIDSDDLRQRAAAIARAKAFADGNPVADLSRSPFFCSGCPHNSSLKKPEGSYSAGGIGCHAMALYHHDHMLPNTHMGGEGAQWIGLGHFTGLKHIFQNMGDGTYYHSGLMAIRGAVASGKNITYKILFNDAVAMTGGQPVEGHLTVGDISRQVLAEGARECVVVSDRPELLVKSGNLAPGVKVHHRDDLIAVETRLRDQPGVTVLIYEQTCAAEKRRRRKRGKFPDPAKRLFINSAVCEGCGDCSVQSSCVSLVPKETPLGRKRAIDQSTCNKDYSCVKGFCPSFVTVKGGTLRKPEKAAGGDDLFADLPEPTRPALDPRPDSYGVMIAGIGGTGVVTVGSVLAMAAHLEHRQASVFDMTGLSQKNGAVYSHLRIAATAERLGAQRLGAGEADLLLAFDMVAAQSAEPLASVGQGRTTVVANTQVVPTAAFQYNPDLRFDGAKLLARFVDMVGGDRVHSLDASGLGLVLSGDTLAANFLLVGYATQLGLLPLSCAAIERAIELNGVSVPFNLQAFRLGRLCAQAPARIEALLDGRQASGDEPAPKDLDTLIRQRVELLSAYQNRPWAERYRRLVERVRRMDEQFPAGGLALTRAVAFYLAKLMAYKDEYEVARLYSAPAFKRQLEDTFEGDYRLAFNLAPPLLARKDKVTGLPKKAEYGAWMLPAFRVLAQLRFLRGTALDIFGYSAERKLERALIGEYEATIDKLLEGLDEGNYATAVDLASVPEQIRGYGHVKDQHLEKARAMADKLWRRFEGRADNGQSQRLDTVEIFEPEAHG